MGMHMSNWMGGGARMPGCEYCHQPGSHDFRCPNYVYPKPRLLCAKCREGIYEGEEYLENDEGERCHYDCFLDTKELIGWLGYNVKKMME